MKGHKIKLALQVKPRGIFHDDDIPPSLSFRGIYSGQPEKLFPPVEFFPCFLGLLLLVSSNSYVFLSPSNSSLFSNLDKKNTPPGGRMARIYIPIKISTRGKAYIYLLSKCFEILFRKKCIIFVENVYKRKAYFSIVKIFWNIIKKNFLCYTMYKGSYHKKFTKKVEKCLYLYLYW